MSYLVCQRGICKDLENGKKTHAEMDLKGFDSKGCVRRMDLDAKNWHGDSAIY